MDEFEQTQLAAIVGAPVVAAERCGWGFENRTDYVTLADGRQLIVQRIANASMAAHKIRLARILPERLAEVGLRLPRLLLADATATPPYAVREYIDGAVGAAFMSNVAGALRVAMAMGALLPKLAQVRTANLGLHTSWANPARLAEQARRQLVRQRALVDAAHVLQLEATIASIETLFANRPAVFAHGDFCPVNALFGPEDLGLEAGSDAQSLILIALLDVEFARAADPLFDAAWWGWVVRYHHEERWNVAFPQLLAAAGIDDDAETRARIHAIQQLRLLEALDYNVSLSHERGAFWAERLAATLAWSTEKRTNP